MATQSVAVIGSLNIDFITRTSRLPEAGETLAAKSFDTGFGGKGANQAVACARLAGDDVKVRMVGNLGEDSHGADYRAALAKEGVDTSGVRSLPGQKSGITNIIVEDETGENRILFVANANEAFSEDREPAWDLVPPEGGVVVFQLEIPLRVVLHNLHLAREHGRHVILNPAPAVLLPDFAYQDIDTLIMNETESHILAGPDRTPISDNDSLLHLAEHFIAWGVRDAVIITLGERGLVYVTATGLRGHVAARKVTVVDTTAAGDSFVGAYAVRRARHTTGQFDYEDALRFATLAASKTVEKAGAMAAIPHLKDL